MAAPLARLSTPSTSTTTSGPSSPPTASLGERCCAAESRLPTTARRLRPPPPHRAHTAQANFAFSASGSAFQRWPGAHLARVGLGKARSGSVGVRGSAGVRAGARARAGAGACPIAFLGPSSRAAEAAAAHGETRCRGHRLTRRI
eukprot:scaffold101905_cov27-Phaeocystis_antarctica.AAC.1